MSVVAQLWSSVIKLFAKYINTAIKTTMTQFLKLYSGHSFRRLSSLKHPPSPLSLESLQTLNMAAQVAIGKFRFRHLARLASHISHLALK